MKTDNLMVGLRAWTVAREITNAPVELDVAIGDLVHIVAHNTRKGPVKNHLVGVIVGSGAASLVVREIADHQAQKTHPLAHVIQIPGRPV